MDTVCSSYGMSAVSHSHRRGQFYTYVYTACGSQYSPEGRFTQGLVW
jgi:hypothetical protein